MPKKIIAVTADNIAHGLRRNESSCPVALAINRELGAPFMVGILTEQPMVEEKTQRGRKKLKVIPAKKQAIAVRLFGFGRIELPHKLINFIETFDAKGRGAVKPMSFEVDVPDSWLSQR